MGGSPNDVAVGADGSVYYTNIFCGTVDRLDPSTGATNVFAYTTSYPVDLTWSGINGNLYVGTIYGGVQVFDPSGNYIQDFYDYGTSAGEVTPAGNVWDSTFLTASLPLRPVRQLPPRHVGPVVPARPGRARRPGERPAAARVAVHERLLGHPVGRRECVVRACPSCKGSDFTMVLEDWLGQHPGHRRLGGQELRPRHHRLRVGGRRYLLRARHRRHRRRPVRPGRDRERGLRRGRLDPGRIPQPLPSSGTVLGAITPGAGLFTLDDTLYTPPFPIYPTDTNTGVFGTPIPSPLDAAEQPVRP